MDKTIKDYVSEGPNVLPKNLGPCDLYEACPTKSWTFVITRDFVSGNDVFIYILETFCTNMVGITIKITKLYAFI